MSSFTDIIKYSATLYMERDKHDRKFVAASILASVAMLALQIWLIVLLELDNTEGLFCGDVVRMINQTTEPSVLFYDYTHSYYKERWSKINESSYELFDNDFWKTQNEESRKKEGVSEEDYIEYYDFENLDVEVDVM